MALDLDLFDPRSTVGEVAVPAVGQDVLLTKTTTGGKVVPSSSSWAYSSTTFLLIFARACVPASIVIRLSLIFMGSPSTVKLLINPLGQTSLHELL
jgi:hypothetical protein